MRYKVFTTCGNSCGLAVCDGGNTSNRPGFALIVTLLMLLLLALLSVGMLSLSAVSLRNLGHGSAQAEARANARMALMLAIGELQKQVGPDQRITANGGILAEGRVENAHWTGVWDSWLAGPLSEAAVNEDYPGAESHHQTIGEQPDDSMRPEYDQNTNHGRLP